jgi:ferric-dicitrate binding protein FerR (iron transport regulator)/regulation of enolase protein 1 (concanavalin A-like superfamily)
MNSLDELVFKWHEGRATADDLRQLNALLERPENRQVLREEFLLTAQLRQACPALQQPGSNIVPLPQPAQASRPWAWVAAAAACVALCALLVKLAVGSPPAALLAGTGARIGVGDVVSTAEAEQSELLLDDGRTSLRLRGGTSLEVLALGPRKEFRLTSGSLLAAVAPQKEPMLIRTPQAEATVLGTEFVLATLPHSTRLEVASGKVRLKRNADGQALDVAGNEFATVAPQASFEPIAQPPAPWKTEDIGEVEMHGYAIVEGSRCLIRGAGRNTCLQKDQLHFMYQKLEGNFDLRARLVSFTARSASARAGLMIRRSLETACRQAFIAFRGDLQVEIQCRPQTDSKEVLLASADLPVWMRIVREGDLVAFSVSHDNENWRTLAEEKIEFGQAAYTGLAVTSFDNDFLGESVFDQVTVTSENGSRSIRLAAASE